MNISCEFSLRVIKWNPFIAVWFIETERHETLFSPLPCSHKALWQLHDCSLWNFLPTPFRQPSPTCHGCTVDTNPDSVAPNVEAVRTVGVTRHCQADKYRVNVHYIWVLLSCFVWPYEFVLNNTDTLSMACCSEQQHANIGSLFWNAMGASNTVCVRTVRFLKYRAQANNSSILLHYIRFYFKIMPQNENSLLRRVTLFDLNITVTTMNKPAFSVVKVNPGTSVYFMRLF